MNIQRVLSALLPVCAISYVGNYIAYRASATASTPAFDPMGALLGMLVILAVTLVGWLLAHHVKIKLESPTVIWISVLGLLVSSPIFPGHNWVSAVTKNVSFMALTTPVLAYAGLSLGRDIGKFRELGWRIVVVSLLVFTGTFVLSSVFAQVVLKLNGTI